MPTVASITICRPGKLGIVFEPADCGVVYQSLQESSEHTVSGPLAAGMVLVGVQETSVEGLGARQALALLASKSEQRPLRLTFLQPPQTSERTDTEPESAQNLWADMVAAPVEQEQRCLETQVKLGSKPDVLDVEAEKAAAAVAEAEVEAGQDDWHSQLEEEHIDQLIAAEAEAACTLEDRLDKLSAALCAAAAAAAAAADTDA